MTREAYELVIRDAELDGRWGDAMRIRIQCADEFPAQPAVEIGSEDPTSRYDWHGKLISLDGCATDDFDADDIARVLAYGDSGDGWDGDAAGIAQLKDGRFVAWESTWGPTGSGFSADAYGGDADIAFSATPGPALEYLSEGARALLRWA